MADSSSVETIMEEREEVMVSPTGGNPTLRTAHFLNPTLTSIRELLSLFLSSNPTISELNKTPLKVLFKGRPSPQKGWKTWVERLQPAYQDIWKKAGIYDAILASTYQTMRHNDLVIGLAERWCVETNTFIFPWGEATITLEDMVVLGGYSVLGYPVFNPLQTQDLIEIEECLGKARRDIRLGGAPIISHYAWMDHFIEGGGPNGLLEHEAFLALWLSRYVFPFSCETVTSTVFPIAIHLSRGTPIALAPAVLATIYRDLSLLKKSMIDLTKLGSCECEGDDALTLTLWAPFQLVQLWAWERFPTLRPNPNSIRCGEPRPARWHRLKKVKVENVGVAMDSASEYFQWRPYTTVVNNWMFSKFYRENEEWVLVKSDMDNELVSFARCLRACELVGLDCIEQYLPHRVAMQFGMDQDVPGYVTRSNETREIAWRNYTRSIKDAEIYRPHRLFESDVTKRYSEWWKQQSMLASKDAIKGTVVRQQRSRTYKRLPRVFRGHWNDNYDFVPCGFPSKCIRAEDVDEDNLTIAEKLKRCYDKNYSFGDHKPLPDVVNEPGKNMESQMKPIEQYLPHRVAMQFGMDQDVPGFVASEWWKQQPMLTSKDAIKGTVVRQQRSRTYKRLPRVFRGHWNDNYDLVNEAGKNTNMLEKLVGALKVLSMQDKALMGGPKGDIEDADVRSLSMRVNNNEEESFGDHKPLPDVVNEAGKNMESQMKPIDMSMQDKAMWLVPLPKGHIEDADVRSLSMRVNNNEEESFVHESFKLPRLELEDRISKLEKLVGALKAAKFGYMVGGKTCRRWSN